MSMSREDFDALCAAAEIDPKEFDEESHKPLEMLFAETEKEVVLRFIPETKQIVRFAKSVGVALVTADDWWLREVARRYDNNKVIPGLKKTAFSGTPRRDEAHPKAAVRETEEETGLVLPIEDFKFLEQSDRPDWHDSTAFTYKKKILSCTVSHTYLIEITRRPSVWGKYPMFRDVEKWIHDEWFRRDGTAPRLKSPIEQGLQKLWPEPTEGSEHFESHLAALRAKEQ